MEFLADRANHDELRWPSVPIHPTQQQTYVDTSFGQIVSSTSVFQPGKGMLANYWVKSWNIVCSASFDGENYSFDIDMDSGTTYSDTTAGGVVTSGTAFTSYNNLVSRMENTGEPFGIDLTYTRNAGSFPQFSCQLSIDRRELRYHTTESAWLWEVSLLSTIRSTGIDSGSIEGHDSGNGSINDTTSVTVLGDGLSCERDSGLTFSLTVDPTEYLPLYDP